MRLHVTFEVFETVTDPSQVVEGKAAAAAVFAKVLADPRVSASGWFLARRAGFFVIELNDPMELMPVVAPLMERFRMQVNAVAPMQMALDFVTGKLG